MLADFRLKIAQKAPTKQKQTLGRVFARVLYNSTGMVWMKDSTPAWQWKDIIPARVEMTRKAAFNSTDKEQKQAFWESKDAKILYKCMSCHSSGVNP